MIISTFLIRKYPNEQVEQYEYIDTHEDLKSICDDGESIIVVTQSRRSSLYLDESDGKYGTWKRQKFDINSDC